MKRVSESGHVAHEGKNDHVGEAFAGKPVGLHLNDEGRTELHFANLHLGNLAFDAEGDRFKPCVYVAEVRTEPNNQKNRRK